MPAPAPARLPSMKVRAMTRSTGMPISAAVAVVEGDRAHRPAEAGPVDEQLQPDHQQQRDGEGDRPASSR